MVVQQSYSLEDANRRLPLVRSIVRDIVQRKQHVLVEQQRLMDLRQRCADADEHSPYVEQLLQLEESLECDEIRIDDFAAELQQIGARLIDAKTGLVEFASELDGQLVRLSWKLGEPDIGFWRSEDDLPTNRRPLLLTGQEAG